MDNRFLASCEAEPLQLSGAIQAHATLLVVDAEGQVSHAAANIAHWLGAPAEAWLERRLPETLAAALTQLAEKAGSRVYLEAAIPAAPGGRLDLVASRGERAVVLELYEHQETAKSALPPSLHPTSVDAADPISAQEILVQEIANITGFQRVMLYLFREDGDGEVIAEARLTEAYGSYLGLRFPASDIPNIARALYLKNPWRLIPDAAAESVPLLGGKQPPDLSYSDLRSVSAMHRLYLANMGVRASLSFPVIMAGTLSALVACHHDSPRLPPLGVLNRASHLVRAHALARTTHQLRQRMRLVDGLAHRFDAARSLLHRHGDALAAWPELGTWLMREFQADGATLIVGDAYASTGTSLEPSALAAFDAWFCQQDFVWAGDSLIRQVSEFPLSEVAGALALRLRLGKGVELRLILCRLEYIHEVAWGGNPDKPVEFHDGVHGIAPRRSFEKWLEKRLGYSRPWDNEARLLALNLREMLLQELRAGSSALPEPGAST